MLLNELYSTCYMGLHVQATKLVLVRSFLTDSDTIKNAELGTRIGAALQHGNYIAYFNVNLQLNIHNYIKYS